MNLSSSSEDCDLSCDANYDLCRCIDAAPCGHTCAQPDLGVSCFYTGKEDGPAYEK